MSEGYKINIIALAIRVKGLVQGVGFRPFVYRLAMQYHLHGWVVNGTDGVTIKVEGIAASMAPFVDDLLHKAPVISQIDEISVDQDIPEGLTGFYILASQDLTDETSEISPDIAVCSDCLAELSTQPHRVGYPFINCTNCGPRFSIIRDFPYDRANTTMAPFGMCEKCYNEYTEINDRRFHAQPVACNQCGPHYSMYCNGSVLQDINAITDKAADSISLGGIIALKGTGGFHLMCDALNGKAIHNLRNIKKREGKPFAVMFRDIDSIRNFAEVSQDDVLALESWRRPVVILKSKQPMDDQITRGLDTLGVFLPYMPFHHLLFSKLKTPSIVLTSGNFADEPIIIDNDDALKQFAAITAAVVTYNREIFNRTDDSVVRIISGKQSIFRRSRGFAPSPVRLGFDVDGILATGAELSNCFCLGKNNRAYLSQHIGDLKNHETFAFYEEAMLRFKHLFRVNPEIIAADLHPDYLSTRFAKKAGLPVIQVQHHHAHIASCMAENGLDEPVIGLAFDGTGYGTDGNIWGSEFLVCDYDQFERKMHFEYMPMPGGDRASEDPWRMGLSLLYQAYGDDLLKLKLPLIRAVKPALIGDILQAIRNKINCPLSSGAGRLFDAVSAITGICTHSLFHSEAPMRLESEVKTGITDYYAYDTGTAISFIPAIRQITEDVLSGKNTGFIAAKFHNTIVEASVQAVHQISNETGVQKVVMSGGSFQNKYLSETLESRLLKNNLAVYTQRMVPCNDGGIALGQLAVAARDKGRFRRK